VFIPDLAPYACAFRWAVPLYAVGWLEHSAPYTRGAAPAELVKKLEALAKKPIIVSMGYHECSFCGYSGRFWDRRIYIPGDGEVFVTPGGADHYIESHSYLPPARFIDAALRCPDPDSAAYWAAMRESNAGIDAPFAPDKQ